MRSGPKSAFFFFWIISLLSSLFSANLPEGFAEVRIASGLNPTALVQTPDGRILLAQKDGRILLVRDGRIILQPVVQVQVDDYNERGLSGLVVDPAFAENGFIYVFYTVPNLNFNRISRLTLQGDFFVPGSELILLEIEPMPGSIHNGGAMAFGPDGYLYIATGDGAAPVISQSLQHLGGKILRIARDGSIPADNPFFTQTTGNFRAIWALGFRNPYTFAIEPGTGRLFVNDVGGSDFEEVNAVVRGGNYGWPIVEGPRTNQNVPANYHDPLHAYNHAVGCAVVGAAFYAPAQAAFPAFYHGKYFFADYCEGFIKVLNPQSGVVEEIFATQANRPLQLLVSADGDLYYLSRAGIGGGSVGDNTSTDQGSLWRVFYQGTGAPIVSVQPADVLVSVGEDAFFAARASGSPPFSYQWTLNGNVVPGAASENFVFPAAQLSDSGAAFACQIGNAVGSILTRGAVLHVTSNLRPSPIIEYPGDGFTWKAGDTLHFRGYAMDPEDGEVDSASFVWKIDLHHNDHAHPALPELRGRASGFFVIPRFGETDHNIWLRAYLTATDSRGLSQTVYNEYFPQKTKLTLLTIPPGLNLWLDGQRVTSPHTAPVVIGTAHVIEAPRSQSGADSVFVFHRYADGTTQRIAPFFAGETDQTVTAKYQGTSYADGTGLLGIYYADNRDQVYDFREQPAFFRLDPGVDFNWDFGSPAPGFPPDQFAVRWLGQITPLFSEEVTFITETDDGARLWIDDNPVIDQWVFQGVTQVAGSYFMERGRKYNLRLEYFEHFGEAVARLLWQGALTPYQVIPARQLFPADRFGIPRDPFSYRVTLLENPVSDRLRLRVTLNQPERLRMRLFDIQGRTVWQATRNLDSPLEELDYQIGHLSAGFYFLETEGLNAISRQVYKIRVSGLAD